MPPLSELLPNRVRALRMDKGWSLAELASRANTTAPQIMKLERSHRRLDLDWIERLAAAFEVSAMALIGGSDDGVTMVPLIGRIAAGNWREAIEDPTRSVPIPTNMLKSPRAFALEPDGDSMDLILPAGGYVLVNPDDGELRDGKVYAVMNGDGETTVKRYRADPSRLEPCSSNPDHKPIQLGREPFTVVGRVTSTHTEL